MCMHTLCMHMYIILLSYMHVHVHVCRNIKGKDNNKKSLSIAKDKELNDLQDKLELKRRGISTCIFVY